MPLLLNIIIWINYINFHIFNLKTTGDIQWAKAYNAFNLENIVKSANPESPQQQEVARLANDLLVQALANTIH